MKHKEKTKIEVTPVDAKISRKQAIKRAGLYAAATAGVITFLGTQKSAAASSTPTTPRDW